jgi:hypothetical protein
MIGVRKPPVSDPEHIGGSALSAHFERVLAPTLSFRGTVVIDNPTT